MAEANPLRGLPRIQRAAVRWILLCVGPGFYCRTDTRYAGAGWESYALYRNYKLDHARVCNVKC